MQLYAGQYSSYFAPDGWESASISDDDEDGEWVDVHHSSDEDAGEMVSLEWPMCVPPQYTSNGIFRIYISVLGCSIVVWIRWRNLRVFPWRREKPKLQR